MFVQIPPVRQTGSGKTYCMMGASEGEHRGIIPRLCEELYERIELDFNYTITVEMQYVVPRRHRLTAEPGLAPRRCHGVTRQSPSETTK